MMKLADQAAQQYPVVFAVAIAVGVVDKKSETAHSRMFLFPDASFVDDLLPRNQHFKGPTWDVKRPGLDFPHLQTCVNCRKLTLPAGPIKTHG